MEHSAEWLRGAVAVARDVREPLAVAHYTLLLAAAEAREAGEHSAGTGITLTFEREEWGLVVDGLIAEIAESKARKACNMASASDVRIEMGEGLLRRVNAAANGVVAETQPSAAEVISKVRAELLKCLDNAKTLPQDARQAGVVAGWESAVDLLEALGEASNDR